MTNLTGEQLFFRYAWPCADIRHILGKITNEQYQHLKFFRDNPNQLPERKLLMTCFPVAAKDLVSAATRMLAENPWSMEHVTEYWRHHHGHPSPVETLVVESVGIDRLWVKAANGEVLQVLNPYSLDTVPGDRVTTHNRHAIEKI